MIYRLYLSVLFSLILCTSVLAQVAYVLQGQVSSNEDNSPLSGANVLIKGSSNQSGAATDQNGNFSLTTNEELPLTIIVSHLNYQELEYRVTTTQFIEITLTPDIIALENLVIEDRKIEERILRSDYSIGRLGIKDIQSNTSLDFYDALSYLQDVDFSTQSIQNKSVNSRGFNSTGNTRFRQLIDGMDNQAPGFNFSLGNFAGMPELDVESVELLPGPSSVRYGSGALNGILLMKSKDPFIYQGTSASLKFAANNIPEGADGYLDFDARPLVDVSVRYAKALNDKIAFKTTLSVLKATDWPANDFRNIGSGGEDDGLPDNSGYNGINVYGDEVLGTLSLGTTQEDRVVNFMVEPVFFTDTPVRRTGYVEGDLVDYDISNVKVSSAVHYKINDDLTAVVQGNLGSGSTFYTGDNRTALRNFKVFQGKAELQGKNFMVRGYTTQQRSGDSFDALFLAQQLNSRARRDTDWFRTYELAYNGVLRSRGVPQEDHGEARLAADGTFQVGSVNPVDQFVPGTFRFDSIRNLLVNTIGFENGAAFKDNSAFYHAEGYYTFDDLKELFDLEVGADYRLYDPQSAGNIFIDTANVDLTMFEWGSYVSLKRSITSRLEASGSIRYDKNENFKGRITPRLGLTYRINDGNYLRGSFQTGFRNPSLREQFSFQNLGANTRIVGGLEYIINTLDLPGNSFLTQSVEEFNQTIREQTITIEGDSVATISADQAALLSLPVLENSIITSNDVVPIKQEKVRTFEIGYRGITANNRLAVDINYYRSIYDDFIGTLRYIKPRTSPSRDLFVSSGQVNNTTEREQFFVFGNARQRVTSQGISASVDYSIQSTRLRVNATWTDLTSSVTDPIIPGFNTPPYKVNFSVENDRILENIGYKISVIGRPSFEWQSNFGDGRVESYVTADVQLNYRWSQIKSTVKVGVQNITNNYYTNTFGGPRIGAMPYIQLIYDSNFVK